MSDIKRPEEGTFFWIPAVGVTMAHYHKGKSASRYAKEEKELLVPLVVGASGIVMDDNALSIATTKIPTKDDLSSAIAMARLNPLPFGTSADAMHDMIQGGDLTDVAKVALVLKAKPEAKQIVMHALGILASVEMHDRHLGKNKNLKDTVQFFTSKTSKAKQKKMMLSAISGYILRKPQAPEELVNSEKPKQAPAFLAQAPRRGPAQPVKPTISLDLLAAARTPKLQLPFGGKKQATPKPAAKPAQSTSTPASATAPKEKPAGKPKALGIALSKEQSQVIKNAVADTKGVGGVITEYTAAAKRISETIALKPEKFEDTVIALRHIFTHPAKDVGETADILKGIKPDTQMDAENISARAKKLVKGFKANFAKANDPGDQAIHRVATSWRPPGRG